MTTDQAQLGAALATPAGPAAPSLSEQDLADLIRSFNEVTTKLEGTHASLRAEVVRLNRELRQANEQLERSRRLAALGEMAAGIAHEIRNPLGSIALYARLLEQDLCERPERRTAQKIRSAVGRLNEVVGDVLTFARELRVRPRDTEAGDLLERAIDGCRDLTPEAVCVGAGALVARCDEGLVVQALVNVIRNACEASREAGATRAVEIGARRQEARDEDPAFTVLWVRDAGPGVSAEVIERMFNPFFTTRESGTGLGLAIVHRIVDAHGGRVVVRNNAEVEPGEPGATVELWVPEAGGIESCEVVVASASETVAA
ncbi:MAG: ATP-binding protein [Phycisphaerales bacterium]